MSEGGRERESAGALARSLSHSPAHPLTPSRPLTPPRPLPPSPPRPLTPSRPHDVVVIGGGPAGCSAAIRLAGLGMNVRLLEKSHFPRPKLCGGFLSPEAFSDLEELGVIDDLQSASVSIGRSVVASMEGRLIETALPAPALSVSRDVLDALLLEAARFAGVHVEEGVTGALHRNPLGITVVATGRASLPPVNQFTPWYASPKTAYFGIQALFTGVKDVTDQVELDLIKSGYVGLARQQEGINVCALTTKEAIERGGPDLDEVLKQFMNENPVLRAHLKSARRLTPWLSVGPVRLGIRQLASDSTFYVGDAACVIDPFAGEGMAMGLYSSRLLAMAFRQSDRPVEDVYAQLWEEAFMPSLRWNAFMRLLYSVPGFREPAMQILEWFPKGMNWLTDLTRYRRVQSV